MRRKRQLKGGPEIITIPESIKLSCAYCKYYDRGMMKSGSRPEYLSRCDHPFVGKEPGKFHIGIIDRYNGSSDTPRWCPYRKLKKFNLILKHRSR